MTSRAFGRIGPAWAIASLASAFTLLSPTLLDAQEADPSLVAEGRTLYAGIGLCFACHGVNGKGVPGAGVDLTDDEWLHDDGSFEAVVQRILSGVGVQETRSGVIMLPRGGSQITDDRVRAVAAYVISLRAAETRFRPET